MKQFAFELEHLHYTCIRLYTLRAPQNHLTSTSLTHKEEGEESNNICEDGEKSLTCCSVLLACVLLPIRIDTVTLSRNSTLSVDSLLYWLNYLFISLYLPNTKIRLSFMVR